MTHDTHEKQAALRRKKGTVIKMQENERLSGDFEKDVEARFSVFRADSRRTFEYFSKNMHFHLPMTLQKN